ncbi:MAG: hypothetical protein HC848_07765 [Limnobacter sp.]|nr:hypothetical protein [Limnobacter sp.]
MPDIRGTVPAGSAKPGNGTFITGGFSLINISDANGQALKKFDKPLQIENALASTHERPRTGKPYKAGDSFPLWSYDEKTAQWTYEGSGLVQNDSNDFENLVVKFETTHLTAFNMDHYVDNCDVTIQLPGDRKNYLLEAHGNAAYPFYIANETLLIQDVAAAAVSSLWCSHLTAPERL